MDRVLPVRPQNVAGVEVSGNSFLVSQPFDLAVTRLPKNVQRATSYSEWRFYVFVRRRTRFLACPRNYSCNWTTLCGVKTEKKPWYVLKWFRVSV